MTAPSNLVPHRAVVLIVDDEASLRDVLQLGLSAQFDVETAASTDEATLMMATREFDIVVCDHLMPHEEGLVFLERAQKQFPRTQRILMTGYMNPDLLSRATALAGLSGCLMKPVSTPDLIVAIRQALPL